MGDVGTNSRSHNLDAGLKLSELNDRVAKAEIEADLFSEADKVLNINMVKMMFKLEGYNK